MDVYGIGLPFRYARVNSPVKNTDAVKPAGVRRILARRHLMAPGYDNRGIIGLCPVGVPRLRPVSIRSPISRNRQDECRVALTATEIAPAGTKDVTDANGVKRRQGTQQCFFVVAEDIKDHASIPA